MSALLENPIDIRDINPLYLSQRILILSLTVFLKQKGSKPSNNADLELFYILREMRK